MTKRVHETKKLTLYKYISLQRFYSLQCIDTVEWGMEEYMASKSRSNYPESSCLWEPDPSWSNSSKKSVKQKAKCECRCRNMHSDLAVKTRK